MKQNKVLRLNEMAAKGKKLVVVKCDETEYWREDIAKKAGKIWAVYLINLQQPTRLCELAISYPATILYYRVENFEAFTEDELMWIETPGWDELADARYYSASSTFEVIKYYTGSEEDAEEYERCNPSYC